MRADERAQWLLLVHIYLVGQRDQAPEAFADQLSLACINDLIWLAYYEATGQHDSADADTERNLERWLLALWPAPVVA